MKWIETVFGIAKKFFTGPISKKSLFFLFFLFTHSELITWRRSGMVGQVGRYLHSTSDDLENETPKINSSFKWDLFLNVCFSLFAPTFTRYSFTEPL